MIQDPEDQYITTILSQCDLRGKDILEIGCGKGRITRDLAKHARMVVATDPDAASLAKAHADIRANNVEFIRAPNGIPEFPAGSFDVVIYTLSLHHVPVMAMTDSLRAAARLVGRNGCIIVVEPGNGGSFLEAKARFGAGSGDETPAREAAIRAMHALEDWTVGETVTFRTQFRFNDDEDFLINMLPNYRQQPETFLTAVRHFLDQHRTGNGIVLDSGRCLNILRPCSTDPS